ncbi:MAG: M56 family metallopeptidase [Bacteroidales bacterium]|nr:M56 family metallopeptidase [Bacteroidales bacterium]
MGGFILYIIKSTLFLTIFYSFFMLVMRRTTFFRFNRIAFILGTAICMVLPFMNIELPAGNAINAPIMALESALSPEITALPGSVITAGESPLTDIRIIDVLFIAGALISFVTTATSYAGMRRMMDTVRGTTSDGMCIKVIDKDFPSFSWGKTIVISRKDLMENPAILTHETMHVKCGHSIDLMVYTVITTLHWFNPLIWIARTELKMLHEYEADELTIKKGIDATQYQLLLVKKAVGAKRFRLANGFNHSKLKNRISMMHKNKTNKWMRLAYILCVPALIGAMCCCSNRNNSVNEEEQPIPFELIFSNCSAQITSSDGHIGATLRDFGISQLEDIINTARHSGEISINVTYGSDVDERMIELLKEGIRNMEINKEISGIQISPEAIPFQLVDVKPTFQGGDANTFSRWVNTNLVYPKEAAENKIQGRITLQFTVSETGKVTNAKVLRGVDPLLDKEALRIIELSPDWTPGKANGRNVPVTFTFPVIFQLR